jgi:outer membrane protein assembly factor BamB
MAPGGLLGESDGNVRCLLMRSDWSRRQLLAGLGGLAAVLATAGSSTLIPSRSAELKPSSQLLWDSQTQPVVGLVASGRTVCAATETTGPVAFHAGTGKQSWTTTSLISPDAAGPGAVFGVAPSGGVSALDAVSGVELWTAWVQGAASLPATGPNTPPILYADGLVYVTGFDKAGTGSVIALNALTGHRVWTASFPGRVVVTFTEAAGMVYAGTTAGGTQRSVVALDGTTGKRRWSKPVPTTTPGLLTATATTVICGTNGWLQTPTGGGTLLALDSRTGRPLWSRNPGSLEVAITGDGTVYAASGSLFALDLRTGKSAWPSGIASVRPTALALSDGVLYAGTEGSQLMALSAVTGRELWSYSTAEPVTCLDVGDGAVYAATFGQTSGHVYAWQV